MSVRKETPFKEGIYFISFTCYNWLSLFAITNAYNAVYKQFDILTSEGHYILGYVIMPNHVHLLIGIRNKGKSINRRIGTMKRFLAYELVARLTAMDRHDILEILSNARNETEKSNGNLHRVFEPSFDCKECFSNEMINIKLDYIHDNPCKGKWELVKSPVDYTHSSAYFYITGQQGYYPIAHYMKMEDVDLTK